MREITTTVYTFDELSEDVQQKAVQAVREYLAAHTWDSIDEDDMRETLTTALADQLGTPGDGERDIPHVTIASFDMDRSGSIGATGTLTRENAPALPWVDTMASVWLRDERNGTSIDVFDAAPDCDCGVDPTVVECEPTCASMRESSVVQEDAMEQAVRDALSEAWQDGEKELEYRSSDGYIREDIAVGGYEFTEDGALYL